MLGRLSLFGIDPPPSGQAPWQAPPALPRSLAAPRVRRPYDMPLPGPAPPVQPRVGPLVPPPFRAPVIGPVPPLLGLPPEIRQLLQGRPFPHFAMDSLWR